MTRTFATLLRKLVRTGNLEVETADGFRHTFGDGSGLRLGARLTDRAAERELLMDPAFHLGELYMDGRLIVTQSMEIDESACEATYEKGVLQLKLVAKATTAAKKLAVK